MSASCVTQEDDVDWGWGVVVNYHKKSATSAPGADADAEGVGSRFIVDVLLFCAPTPPSAGPQAEEPKPAPCPPELADRGEMRVVPVLLPNLDGISSIRVFVPKDLRPPPARASVRGALTEAVRRFPDGLPLLDPVEDMRIRSDAFTTVVGRVATVQGHLAENPFQSAPDRDARYAVYQSKVRVGTQCVAVLVLQGVCVAHRRQVCARVFATLLPCPQTSCCGGGALASAAAGLGRRNQGAEEADQGHAGTSTAATAVIAVRVFRAFLSAVQNLVMKDTCKKMMRVLRRLGHIDGDNVVQLKVCDACSSSLRGWLRDVASLRAASAQGRVACEINTADELLVTELMFNGAFNDLSPAQSVRTVHSAVRCCNSSVRELTLCRVVS